MAVDLTSIEQKVKEAEEVVSCTSHEESNIRDRAWRAIQGVRNQLDVLAARMGMVEEFPVGRLNVYGAGRVQGKRRAGTELVHSGDRAGTGLVRSRDKAGCATALRS